MFIISQNRDVVVNVNNITNIYIENENRIIARAVDSEEIFLGMYLSRTNEVFKEMLLKVFPPTTLIFKNCELDMEDTSRMRDIAADAKIISVKDDNCVSEARIYDCGVYYMPEG